MVARVAKWWRRVFMWSVAVICVLFVWLACLRPAPVVPHSAQVFCDFARMDWWSLAMERRRLAALTSDWSVQQRAANCQLYFDSYLELLQPRAHFAHAALLTTQIRRLSAYGSDRPPGVTRLAFSILAHENAAVTETLLHLIFRPYHSYCVHVDAKAGAQMTEAIRNVVGCFQQRFPAANIFMADFPLPVFWGHISLLDAELQCLELLHQRAPDWQYYLNLAGSELPLMPIWQIERYIDSLPANSSIVSSYPITEEMAFRYQYRHVLPSRPFSKWQNLLNLLDPFYNSGKYGVSPVRTDMQKRPPPFNLTIHKGYKNVVLHRSFVQFALQHPVAVGFRKWVADMMIPDESFFPSLYQIAWVQRRSVNQSFSSRLHTLDRLELLYHVKQKTAAESSYSPFCIRRSLWNIPNCRGQLIREICNLAVGDLPISVNPECAAANETCLFVNKVDLRVDPASMVCIAQHILIRDAIQRERQPCPEL